MREFARSQPLRLLLAVVAWRGASELVARWRELAATGELRVRVAARRARRIDDALARAGLRAYASTLVGGRPELARVPVHAGVHAGVHASVHVGAIGGADLDDVGLLEAAMRRAADRRSLVTPVDDRSEAHRTDWGGMLGEERVIERARRTIDALGALPLLAMVAGVTLTFYPLVRPLDDASPWLAMAGLALVAAGVLASRWAAGRREDADPDGADEGDLGVD
jgi:hypothetical protein